MPEIHIVREDCTVCGLVKVDCERVYDEESNTLTQPICCACIRNDEREQEKTS